VLKISIVSLNFPKVGDLHPKILEVNSLTKKNISRQAKIRGGGGNCLPCPLPPARTPLQLSGNDSGQVVHTHVPLSSNCINWCRPRGGDAVALCSWKGNCGPHGQ